MNFIELFNAGGIPLVLSAGFVVALLRIIKYFVSQIDAATRERQEITAKYTEERKMLIEKFEIMYSNHCNMVADALTKQEIAFKTLINKLELLFDKLEAKL